MTFFTKDEFVKKYPDWNNPEDWKIEAVCEKIYSQIGLAKRGNWDITNVPDAVKRASMEQLRFMFEYDIPFIDYKGVVRAGDMSSELNSDISTLALTILGNNGYLYRGSPLNSNMGIGVNFGSN